MNDLFDIQEIMVSIIVPVYNIEKYIGRCVNSIIEQEHKNIEIILIDDGSSDGSGDIIDGFAQKDHRINVIHKKNEGVSCARNKGLEIAKGEYILFIDGDDYIDRDYTSYFLKLAIDNKCDIAMGLNRYIKENEIQIKEDTPYVLESIRVMEKIYTERINVAVWNKIYNRSFLCKNNIRFNNEIWYGEGMLFNIKCLQYTDKVAIGERKVYHQVYRPNSAMRNFNLESSYCGIRSLELQKKLWTKADKRLEDSWSFHYRCFSFVILTGLIKTGTEKLHPEEYKKCIRDMHKDIFAPLRVDIALKRKIVYLAAAICPVLVAKRFVNKEMRMIHRLNNCERQQIS